jgi:cbb3-type cytochrome oxidase maturation protein
MVLTIITLGTIKAAFGQGAISMLSSVWSLLIAGATMGMVALIAFLWGVKNGVFENAEDAKYIVFRDEDDD